jgi:hypothetical protein
MILTDQQEWVDLFDALKSETRKSSEKHVNIYVSASDTDSVCSLRILEVSSSGLNDFLLPIDSNRRNDHYGYHMLKVHLQYVTM